MSLELCKKCGRMHYGTDPCPAPKKLAVSPIAEKGSKPKSDPLGKVAGHMKSTAARKDVLSEQTNERSARKGQVAEQGDAVVQSGRTAAASRVSPVQIGASTAGTQAPPVDVKPKRGRPASIKDKRAYKTQKQREYRARNKGDNK